MDAIFRLFDESASAALVRATQIERDLRSESTDGCGDEMHALVADIVSLRNAAELLRRQLAHAS
jgi:hypothetical protein